MIVVIAFVAKSSATIVPFTIFADVTVLSPGVRPSELISKLVGRYWYTYTKLALSTYIIGCDIAGSVVTSPPAAAALK